MKPVAYMIWASFTGPAQFTTDPRAPEMAARRADYTCTPLVTERDALAAVEQARREEREACALAATAAGLPEGYMWGRDAMEQFDFGKKRAAAAIRARGENKNG